jgi:hypothetical protein
MKKLNTGQIIGITIILIGFTIHYLTENIIINIISGVLFAIGLGLVFKWIHFGKKDLTE